MKVGYVLGEFPSLSETFILREILALRTAGVEIQIIALRRGEGNKVHEQARPLLPGIIYRARWIEARWWRKLTNFAVRHPLRVCALPARLCWLFRTHPDHLAKMLCRIPEAICCACEAEDVGVAHLHAHFAFLPSDMALMMAMLIDAPFSASLHARDIYTQNPRLLACKLSRAAFIVTCSQYNRDHLLTMLPGFRQDKIHLLRHGLEFADFRSSPRARDLILSIGRLEEKKGFEHLLEACRLLRTRGISHDCVIIGEGAREQLLRKLIRRLGIEECVRLLPMLTQEELMPYYRRALVFVQPSVVAGDGDRDALPNVLLEAMAFEVPVVASRLAAIPEVVVDGETGLLAEPGNSGELADRIARLLQDRSLAGSLAANARRVVEENFDIIRNVAPLKYLFTGASITPADCRGNGATT